MLAGMPPRPRRSFASQISGPAELLQAVPYLLGFHPAASLVLLGLDAGRLVVTARLDLADAARGGVGRAVEPMVRGGSTSFVAVIYDDGDDEPVGYLGDFGDLDDLDDWYGDDGYGEEGFGELLLPDVATRVARAVGAVGAALLDVIVVCDGRWWSYGCLDPDCCPPDGHELPATSSAFAAAATFDGVVPLPDRAALEALLEPLPDTDREALDPAIERAENAAVRQTLDGQAARWATSIKRALFRAARAADDPGFAGLPDDDVGRFGAALAVTAIRDAVWMAIDDRRLDGRALWRDLGRRLPGPYDTAALFLYGWAAWRAGDGALAGIAAERALESNPDYHAAELLLAAVDAGVDPRRMPRLRASRS
jgi:Domain of unknown function (DUF4192)